MFAALCSYAGVFVRVRVPLFATHCLDSTDPSSHPLIIIIIINVVIIVTLSVLIVIITISFTIIIIMMYNVISITKLRRCPSATAWRCGR